THAIAYGRTLQVVNILLDRTDDTGRGVDFWPTGWKADDMARHARQDLVLAHQYVTGLGTGPARLFCEDALNTARRALDEQPWVRTGRKGAPR
ncbi:hypothetical protein ACWFR0_32575, partial [Streptomyces noursei]